jgi:hypothetical protein
MADSYSPITIEEKWQARWAERGTNTYTGEDLRSAERPFYNLADVPVPVGGRAARRQHVRVHGCGHLRALAQAAG